MASKRVDEAHMTSLDSERKTREATEREDKLNMDSKRDTDTKEVKEGGQPRKSGYYRSTIV